MFHIDPILQHGACNDFSFFKATFIPLGHHFFVHESGDVGNHINTILPVRDAFREYCLELAESVGIRQSEECSVNKPLQQFRFIITQLPDEMKRFLKPDQQLIRAICVVKMQRQWQQLHQLGRVFWRPAFDIQEMVTEVQEDISKNIAIRHIVLELCLCGPLRTSIIQYDGENGWEAGVDGYTVSIPAV